jgi:hypothetical protein
MELQDKTSILLVKRSSGMKFVKLKVNDSGTYDDYISPADVKRIKERDSLVSILVTEAGASNHVWLDLVLDTGQGIEDIRYLLDCGCNGTVEEGG